MRESIFVLCWGDERFYHSHPAFLPSVAVYATEEQAMKAKADSLLSVIKFHATRNGAKSDVISNRMARALHEANIYSREYSRIR